MTSELPVCRYGSKCYRKAPEHRAKWFHPDEPPESDTTTSVLKNCSADSEDPKGSTTDTQAFSKKRTRACEPVEPKLAEDVVPHKKAAKQGSKQSKMTLKDQKAFIKENFLVEMPADFYDLWIVAMKLNQDDPSAAFEEAGFELVGPYDVLAGRFDGVAERFKLDDYLVHWRYYYDPPEFQTVVKGNDQTGFHIGYYRDDPNELSTVVCSNAAAKSCTLTILGDNIFAAIHHEISENLKAKKSSVALKRLMNVIEETAKEKGYALESNSKKVKDRKKKVVCQTFHGAGVVVPIVNDVGYRELPETNANLKKMLNAIAEASNADVRAKKMEALEEIITFVQFANDECDYGEGLELGIDLFCHGSQCFNTQIKQLLSVAYSLLSRQAFGKIMEAHMANRKKGADLSIV